MKTGIKLLTHAFFCLAACFLFLKKLSLGHNIFIYALVLSLIAAFYHFVREKSEKFWIFVSLHLLGIIGVSIIISLGGNVQYLGYMGLAVIVYSIFIRYAPIELDAPQYFHLLFFILTYYMAPGYRTICLYMTIAYFLMVLLYNNLESMNFYVATRSLTVSLDEKGLKQTNRYVTLIYVGILGVILCLVGVLHTNQIWRMIGRFLRNILRFIGGLFKSKTGEEPIEEPGEELPGEMGAFTPEELTEPSRFAEILSEIIKYLLLAAFVIVVITILVKVIVRLYHYFYESKVQEDTSIIVERVSRLDRKVKRSRTSQTNLDIKPTNRIRKLYKKLLRKNGAKKFKKMSYLSPKEQLNMFCNEGYDEGKRNELQFLYEKARYSNSKITAEDISKFKSIYNEGNTK